jgi:hypothetical protein
MVLVVITGKDRKRMWFANERVNDSPGKKASKKKDSERKEPIRNGGTWLDFH